MPSKKVGTPIKKAVDKGRLALLNRNVHGGGKRNVISGKVNGVDAIILVDTGADFGYS